MADWQLQRDLASTPGLRLRLHRIGLAHWHAGTRLRSWGVAPLHREGDQLLAPCNADEALWLGAWLDDEHGSGTLRLRDAAGGQASAIALPQDFQLTELAAQPITLAPGQPERTLQLDLRHARSHAVLTLALLPAPAWAQRAGRPAPDALNSPPPLPPRYG